MPLRSGDTLGRYVIDDVIGHGGMGSVYRAHDTRLQRRVALKVLTAPAGGSDGAGTSTGGAARIVREARIAAKLEHPNVVAIYDVDELTEGALAGTAYLAMELVEGRSLRSYVGDTSVPMTTRVRWLTDVARGLAAAHDRGLVHRDVKPENVMVRSDGVAKVLDFGIAKQLAPAAVSAHVVSPHAESVTQEGALAIVMPVAAAPKPGVFDGGSVHSPSITGEGIVVGTPYYMSPEQMKGTPLDARTDEFSWGVLAYELLCGVPPWDRQLTPLNVVAAILGTDPTDPHAVNPEVPAWLAEIVLRAMAKSVDARFASMHDVVARLQMGEAGAETLEAKAPLVAPPAPRASRARFVALGMGGVLALVAIVEVRRFAARPSDANVSHMSPASPAAAAPPGSCASSSECTKRLGAPSLCTTGATRSCVALASPDCHVAADPAALASDDTLWIGSLYPETGPAADMGLTNERATELARQDFAQAAALGAGGDRVRPIGLVACDDGTDGARAAKHLVEELGVPAIVGFRTGDELLALSSSILGVHHTLAIATLTTSPLVTQVPHAPGEPPLVWRTTYSFSEDAPAMSALIKDVIEPGLRAMGATTTRIALLRLQSASQLTFSEGLFDALRFNGKSALDNGNDYREFIIDRDTATPETYAATVARLRDFEPNIVLYNGPPFIDGILEPLEKTWPATARVRPRYVSGFIFDDALVSMVGTDRELRKRMFAFTLPSTTPVNGRFTLHYNGAYGTSLSRADAPSSAYDGFYVAAYASLALGGAPATGPNLARAIGKLVPPGAPVEVGPSGIYQAFTHLRAGESIDLTGAAGPLDFDLQTGEHRADLSLLCLDVDKHGKAVSSLESGMVYSANTGALTGTMRCP